LRLTSNTAFCDPPFATPTQFFHYGKSRRGKANPGAANLRRWVKIDFMRILVLSKAAVCLALSVSAVVTSFTTGGEAFCYGILRPFGAIMFILFYILHVLEREVAKFDDANHSETHPGVQEVRDQAQGSTPRVKGLFRRSERTSFQR